MGLFGRQSERDERRAQEWGEWIRQRHPLAITSAGLGILSVIEAGVIPIFSIGGLVLGIISLKQLRGPSHAHLRGHRLAWLGIVLSTIALVIGTSLYVHSFLS